MSWLKRAKDDVEISEDNVSRLQELKTQIRRVANLVMGNPRQGYEALLLLSEMNVLKGRDPIQTVVKSAISGENHQKLALDNPLKVRSILQQAETMVDLAIVKEQKRLQEEQKEQEKWKKK